MTVEGVGFISDSVVRVDGVSVPTTFVNIRTLKASVPSSVVARALPNRFNEPGPFQLNGVYGDRTSEDHGVQSADRSRNLEQRVAACPGDMASRRGGCRRRRAVRRLIRF